MEHLEASEFALRIFLLFFPGLIAVFVLNALTVHTKRTPFDVLATSFVLGVTAYVVYWVFLKAFGNYLSQFGYPTT